MGMCIEKTKDKDSKSKIKPDITFVSYLFNFFLVRRPTFYIQPECIRLASWWGKYCVLPA